MNEQQTNDTICRAAEKIRSCRFACALTGAGISVESGIPPFRGKGGIWEKIDPMEFAHIDAFNKDPGKVWRILIKEMKDVMTKAVPNKAHTALARMESLGYLKSIITQNVDNLHQIAGNTDVIEFHGSFARSYCMDCNKPHITTEIDLSTFPPRCECNGILRPDCVFFGEMIPLEFLEKSRQIAMEADVMIVIGTSAVVQPAAMMPLIAKETGAFIIEINPEKTPLTHNISDLLIQGPAGLIMDKLISTIETTA